MLMGFNYSIYKCLIVLFLHLQIEKIQIGLNGANVFDRWGLVYVKIHVGDIQIFYARNRKGRMGKHFQQYLTMVNEGIIKLIKLSCYID
jgi:hypothetical protein